MRRAGSWIAYVLVALIVSGLWAGTTILSNMIDCDLGGTCENWIGVGILAAAPAVMFVVAGGVAVTHARDEEARQRPDVRGPEVD